MVEKARGRTLPLSTVERGSGGEVGRGVRLINIKKVF